MCLIVPTDAAAGHERSSPPNPIVDNSRSTLKMTWEMHVYYKYYSNAEFVRILIFITLLAI